MAKIYMDIESLTKNASNLAARAATLTDLKARLDALIERIAASWEGEASAAYIQKMREYSKKVIEMIELVEEYKKYVDRAAEDFSKHDTDSASRIRGSF